MVIYEILQSSKNEWTTATYDNMGESYFLAVLGLAMCMWYQSL